MATVGQRIRQRWQRARYNQRALWATFTGRKEYPFSFPTWRTGNPIPSLINFDTYVREGYNRNELVYACITLVASNAASAPLKAWKLEDGKREAVELPLIEVLNRPNPRQSRYEFFEMIDTFLNLEGNAFAVKLPDEHWLARPDRMRQVFGGNDLLGYVYIREDETRIPFLPDEIIHTKMPNPGDPYDGLGRGIPPLGVAAYATDVDNKAMDFLRAFFDNAAVPYGMLTTKNILEDDEVVRIRERIREQYSSSKKWHEIMILDAEAEYQKLGADISEIAWPDLRKVTETRICMAFKVPPIMVGAQAGLDRSTFANTEQSEKQLWRQKIVPDNERVASAFTNSYYDELPDGVFLAHDYSEVEALQESRDDKFERAQKGAVGGWLTVDEARAEVGLMPVPGGKIFLRPLMIQAVDATAADVIEDEEEPREDPEEELSRKSLFEEIGKRFHKTFDLIARSWETRFLDSAREQFAKELVEMHALLGDKHRKTKGTFDDFSKAMAEYMDMHGIEEWELLFLPLFAGLMGEQAVLLAETLGMVVWDVTNPEVQAFISDYSFKFANGLGATTKESLRGLTASAQAEGWSINKLRDELTGIYGGWDKTRAQMIAQTETIRSSNAGAVASYAKAGIEYKQWFTAQDGKVCGFCQEMHAKIVGVSDNYWAMGDTMNVEVPDEKPIAMTFTYEDVGAPPLHPNCLVGETPVLAPDKVAGFVATYGGPIVELCFANSRRLSVTPNHILLTPSGFVRAADIRQGDEILDCPDFERVIGSDPNNYGQPAMIEDIVKSFAEAPSMATRRVPVSPEYLHGDAALMDGHIDIVAPHSFLGGHGQSAIPEPLSQKDLSATNADIATLPGEGDFATMLLALGRAARGSMSGTGISPMLFGGSSATHQPVSFGTSSDFDTILREPSVDNRTTDAEALRQCVLRFASLVSTQKVVDVQIRSFSGHVYDLHTQSSLYIANGIVSSNCRCTILPVVEEV